MFSSKRYLIGVAPLMFATLVVAGCSTSNDDNDLSGQTSTPTVVMPEPVSLIEMPNVVGLSRSDAVAELEELGLIVANVVQESSLTASIDKVISQSPEPEVEVEPTGNIRLTVSSGAPRIEVPGVVGRYIDDVAPYFENLGLAFEVIVEKGQTPPTGMILRQNPNMGAEVPVGTSVELHVSEGVVLVEVPDVSGMTLVAAVQMLINAGLVVDDIISYEPSAEVPTGSVIRSNPSPPALLHENSTVEIVVAVGAEPEPTANSNLNIPDETDAATESPAGSITLKEMLNSVTVEAENTEVDYDRDDWKHWIDQDGNGLDTRQEVLIAESLVSPEMMNGYGIVNNKVTIGRWISVYDNVETTTPSTFDVDHVVPLAEAHQSGGWKWNADTKKSYANDLLVEHHLVAVSASSNRSKGAKDPAEWLPSNTNIVCSYLMWWTAIKISWELSMDQPEKETILEYADNECSNTTIKNIEFSEPDITNSFPTIKLEIDDANNTESESTNTNCHPAYTPCLPNRAGDTINCGDLNASQRPVTVKTPGIDPYELDRDGDGTGCS